MSEKLSKQMIVGNVCTYCDGMMVPVTHANDYGHIEGCIVPKIKQLEAQVAKHEWLDRMDNESIAAELSGTFDLGLPLARKIATWIQSKESEG